MVASCEEIRARFACTRLIKRPRTPGQCRCGKSGASILTIPAWMSIFWTRLVTLLQGTPCFVTFVTHIGTTQRKNPKPNNRTAPKNANPILNQSVVNGQPCSPRDYQSFTSMDPKDS